jgi:2-oxoisovalerate dehydrogenase E1 component
LKSGNCLYYAETKYSFMHLASAEKTRSIPIDLLLKAYSLMFTAKSMADLYEEKKEIAAKYVHSTSRGHEAIQVAVGLQLEPFDYASLYYRDESMLLAIGLEPYELMLQLMAKGEDPFSGGRTYYCHPSLRRAGFPVIPHQSSATGMQAIPATGMAHGLKYLEAQGLLSRSENSVVVCSLGDGSITEGEVAEAFQMAVLKKLPILFLVQDNEWGISATASEMRAMNAFEYASGFKGLKRYSIDGSVFNESYECVREVLQYIRKERGPVLIHARCPIIGHHTSGVRREWYRAEDLELHRKLDPVIKLKQALLAAGETTDSLNAIESEVERKVKKDFERALKAPDPDPSSFDSFEFVPTPITVEAGNKTGKNSEKVMMVDAALHAIDEILYKHPEALFYGQDVGRRLGGVFREAATLAQKYGDHRVFNTPIQEAYIIGSTAGMAAVGAKPIVEIQFADYVWPGLNQLVEELSKSCYLTKGKFSIQSLIRIPTGAYGGGGPYHSGSIESTLLTIRGIKVVYPSNTADMKGLMKAAFYDPNPVVMLEHKGLYWSKVPGTSDAKRVEPDDEYCIPLGKANMIIQADSMRMAEGESGLIITYGMGVYWAMEASAFFDGRLSILDLRTLNPLDWEMVVREVRKHGRAFVLTEEPLLNSFAESLAGRISKECFQFLDAPVWTYGSANLPAVPLNAGLEKMMLPSAEKVKQQIDEWLAY